MLGPMAVFDLQTFVQERLRSFDESMDVSSGSPADVQLIQPLLRRLGTDPFTVDMAVFVSERARQAFPEMATEEGDAITDLLIKPAVLIWDAIVREIFRIRSSQSFKDPSTLTVDEAEALGANLFAERDRGDVARVVGRIYYAQPRVVTISPINFFTSRGGLNFFPDGQQTITVEEMLLNVDGSLYYFDVNLVAEAAGTGYNIDKDELVSVANMEGTARITNLQRARSGLDEETAVTFIDRAQQELTERSMVTLRGIGSRVPKAFPDVTRLAVAGFGDPEMQRDVLRGGGFGGLLSAGMLGSTQVDGEGQAKTRRFQALDAGVNFTTVLDPMKPEIYVLTLFGAFPGSPFVRDVSIKTISLDGITLDLVDQVLAPYRTTLSWSIRKRELTLSGIPGGILFPDSGQGVVSMPDDEVHVGGLLDVSVRGDGFDSSTLVIDEVTDAHPVASGNLLECPAADAVTLTDWVLGTNYAIGDAIYQGFADAKEHGFTLQILTGSNSGDYRVLDVWQTPGTFPILLLDGPTNAIAGTYKWRLVDVIDMDLVEPKNARVSGTDMQSLQHSDVLMVSAATDLLDLGVGIDDTVRIETGLDAKDYLVKDLPAANQVKVDSPMTATASDLKYSIFKANSGGGLVLPFVRVTKVELLDTSGQPVGSTVPYAKPIDIQSSSFENPGRGIKADLTDALLGILSTQEPEGITPGFNVGGKTLVIQFLGGTPGYPPSMTVNFSAGPRLSSATVAAELNAAAVSAGLGPNTVLAVVVPDADRVRVGIVPIDPYIKIASGTAFTALFVSTVARTTMDVWSDTINGADGIGWIGLTPTLSANDLDVLQVLDGSQAGFYGDLTLGGGTVFSPLHAGNPAVSTRYASFAPQVGRHVQVGARSIGRARCYFLEPTSIEFSRGSYFSAVLGDNALVRFFPDPTLDSVHMPAYPSTVLAKTGSSTGTSSLFTDTDTSQDFVLAQVVPGYKLVIKYKPIIGSVVLASSVALAGLTVIVNTGSDQTVMFVRDSESIPVGYVTKAGVASQINAQLGRVVAKISSSDHLEFEGDMRILVRRSGTANATLGFSTSADSNNTASHAGTYRISDVSKDSLTLATAIVGTGLETRESYEIRRPGMQRICATQMNSNKAEAGLYFCDVELVSEGTGDGYNIDAGVQMTADGYRSDGYYLTTEDANLTFSQVERPVLHISRSILEVGVSDSHANATQLTGQPLAITYDRSTLVADVQNFMLSETERVVCSNPLARHLVPHFIRFDFEYVGGSNVDLVVADMVTYIRSLFPSDFLESSDLIGIAYRRGATGVISPIDMLAVIHNYDRSIWAQRSQNALNAGRMAAFVADVLNVNRRSS